MLSIQTDEHFMREALKEAHKALALNEVPIGSVVVANNQIIGRGHNLIEQLNDVSAHAEMMAMTAAANYLGGKYLQNCSLYVTLEPCVMCAGASFWFQVEKIVFGAYDSKRGFTQINQKLIHPKTTFVGGILEAESSTLIKSFFESKRK